MKPAQHVSDLIATAEYCESLNGTVFSPSIGKTALAANIRAVLKDLAAARTVLARWKEFLQEVEIAEDRSNLDGDSAEVVLGQLNDGAGEMLKLTPEGVRDELAAVSGNPEL